MVSRRVQLVGQMRQFLVHVGVLAEGMSRTFPSREGPPSAFHHRDLGFLELKLNVLTKSSNGYTSRLVNLRREDIDPALFQPPADYTIIDP